MRFLHPADTWIDGHTVGEGEVVVAMSRDELAVLANSIGEALEAVEGWEFDARLGVGREDARDLRDQIDDVLRSVPRMG